jgi:tRNA dimethylallyltransferase
MPAVKTKIVAVVGPTASGKTSLSVELAKKFNGEVVSCDSMQVYREMSIGTAKPTEEEMQGIRHHMLDFADPKTVYTCADYVRDAKEAIAKIVSNGKVPIICGGTGLYLDSLLRGGSFEETEVDLEYRQELERIADEKGNEYLHEMLEKVDPESAAATHYNNRKRVIRALEIYKCCGISKSELDRRSRLFDSEYDSLTIGLRFINRELLYDRINKRVDIMLEMGLEDEIRRLMEIGVFESNGTAKQAIGYKELIGYINGHMSYENAVEQLKMATRRYAKRQMTWFSAHGNVNWIDIEEYNFKNIFNIASNLFINFI